MLYVVVGEGVGSCAGSHHALVVEIVDGEGVGSGAGSHHSSGFCCGCGCGLLGVERGAEGETGGLGRGTRKSRMSVCLSRRPIACRAFLNCCALMRCLVLCFSGLSGVCFCCRMRLLYLVGAVAEVVVSAVAVDFRFCTSRFHFALSWASFSIADQSSFIGASMQRSPVVGEL